MSPDDLLELAEQHGYQYALVYSLRLYILLDVDPGEPQTYWEPGYPACIERAALLDHKGHLDELELEEINETQLLNRTWDTFHKQPDYGPEDT